jgi:hypothetical protein
VAESLFWSTADATADEALGSWLHSQTHRANLLSATWRDVGVSAVHVSAAAGAFDDGDLVIAAEFGSRH